MVQLLTLLLILFYVFVGKAPWPLPRHDLIIRTLLSLTWSEIFSPLFDLYVKIYVNL